MVLGHRQRGGTPSRLPAVNDMTRRIPSPAKVRRQPTRFAAASSNNAKPHCTCTPLEFLVFIITVMSVRAERARLSGRFGSTTSICNWSLQSLLPALN
jgi:hypothetical protein